MSENDRYEELGGGQLLDKETGEIGLRLVSPIGLWLFGSLVVYAITVIAIPIILIVKALS